MNTFKKKDNLLVTIFLLLAGSFLAQTQQQAKNFINMGMNGVYKVEKEILKGSLPSTTEPEFKKTVKYQFIAVKLYDQNKFADAVVYSYKARVMVMEILNTTDTFVKEKMKVTDEEKTFFDASKVGDVKITSKILNANDSKRIDDLNTSNYEEFRKLELSIPIE